MSPTPGVVTWFRVYCGALALVYLACLVGGMAMIVFSDRIDASGEMPRGILLGYAALLILLGLVFAAAFSAGIFLPPRPWVWIYGIVLIAVGFTSACCIPFCVPLLIYWLKPEAKAYFGRPA